MLAAFAQSAHSDADVTRAGRRRDEDHRAKVCHALAERLERVHSPRRCGYQAF